jgi:photosystem II stability/assembly factor-like uncharacterized protein
LLTEKLSNMGTRLLLKTISVLLFLVFFLNGNSQSVLFQENFESSTSNWATTKEGFTLINENGNNLLKVLGYNELTFGDSFWDDYRYTVHAKTIDGSFFLTIRISDRGGYFLSVNPTSINLNHIKRQNGIDIEYIALAAKDLDIGLNTWHIFKTELKGNNIKVYVDNEKVFDVIDKDPEFSGKVGINTYTNGVTYFDNILVETDRIIPKQEFPWIGTSGPIGGMGYDVRIHPVNHDIMFVTDVWSGLHKSYDGGKTWHPRNKGIDFRNTPTMENKFGPSGDAIPIFCVTIDPINPDIVWCGTQGYRGIYKSVDCGENWTKMTNGISEYNMGITFRSFAVDPTNSDIVFAACEIGTGNVEVLGAIFRTTDGGQNWTKVLDSQSLIRIILIDPRNPKIIFATTGIFDRGCVKEEGIWKSIDGGNTWFHANNGIDTKALSVEGLDFSVKNPDIMYASTGRSLGFGGSEETDQGAIYRSDDGGNTWRTVLKRSPGMGFLPLYIAISAYDPDIVYVGVSADSEMAICYAILRTMDGGKTWNEFKLETDGIRGGNPVSVAVHPHYPNIVYVNFYGGGVEKSTDYGSTWNICSNGYTGAQIYDLTIDAIDASVVYCTSREGPFKSTNGGKDWIGLGYGDAKGAAEWGAIQINPKNSKTVILGRGSVNILLKSNDCGYNWRNVLNVAPNKQSDYTIVTSISWSQSDTTVVFASFHFVWNRHQLTDSTGAGIYKSEDAGETWNAVNNGFEGTKKNVLTVEVHPKNSNIVFCSLTGEGIYRSIEGGTNWIKKNNGIINYHIKTFAFDPVDENTVYAGIENGGIFKSLDLGESWTQITRGMDQEASIRSIVINPQNHLDIFAQDWFSGVYRSTDGGNHWDLFNKGLTTRAGQSLAISNDGKVLYAGSEGAGVFRLTLAEFETKIYGTTPDTANVIRIKKGDSVEFMIDAYDFNTDTLNYSWSLNSAILKKQDLKNLTFQSDSLEVGSYILQSRISDKGSASSVKWIVEIYDLGTKIDDLNNDRLKFVVFPNPNSGKFILRIENSSSKSYQVQIFNGLGQLQFSRNIYLTGTFHEQEFELSHLPKGNYYVKVSAGETAKTQMIILQ